MKIAILSDLHLEFGGEIDFPDADVLVCAGDIAPYRFWKDHSTETGQRVKEFFETVNEKYKKTFVVLGNHEFYGFDVSKKTLFKDIAKDFNFTVLDNDVEEFGGIKFVGTTLWTNPDIWAVLQYSRLNDFREIQYNGMHFAPSDYVDLHREAVNFLKAQNLNGAIVVTHHLPSFQSIHGRFHGSSINGWFATDMNDFIRESGARMWIHGHTHIPCHYMIGDTRIVCNPRGYYGIETILDPIVVGTVETARER